MRRALALAFLGLLAAAHSAAAEEPVVPAGLPALPSILPEFVPPSSPVYVPYLPPLTVPEPTPPPPPAIDPRLTSPFAQPTEAGGQPSRTFNENFDGDIPPIFYRQTVVTGFATVPRVVGFTQQVVGFTQQVTVIPGANGAPSRQIVSNVPITVNTPVVVQDRVPFRQTVRLPLVGRYNGVSVVDNGNVLPVDQAYFGYNFYSNAGAALNPLVGGSDLQRQTAGFEKRLLDGNASVGMRLPFVQQYGPFGLGAQEVGDLTVLLKYAFYNNPGLTSGVSGGLAITAPTGGGSAILADGSRAPHSWLLQPWGGFVQRFGQAYVQGITNLIAPTDGRDVTLLGNSLGLGYWLYQAPANRLLTGITPVAEIHVRTPLNHRDPNGLVWVQDQVNLTSGVHFRFNRAVISGAVVVPVVGPKPFDVEAIGYATYWF